MSAKIFREKEESLMTVKEVCLACAKILGRKSFETREAKSYGELVRNDECKLFLTFLVLVVVRILVNTSKFMLPVFFKKKYL